MTRPYNKSRESRFASYIRKEPAPEGIVGECWIWTKRIVDGYGGIWDSGRDRLAHIVSYEHFVGPVPEGKELDHLCRRRACINPEHLEPVSHKENVLRGQAPTIVAHITKRCMNGLHKLEGDNVIHTSDGFVTCRACRKAAQRAWYERKLARKAGRPIEGDGGDG